MKRLNVTHGLAGVKIGEKWGYINRTGEVSIKPQFDEVSRFSEGLAPIKKNVAKNQNISGERTILRIKAQWGYIDTAGKIVISPQFDWGFSFNEGLAPVLINGKKSYINKSGDFLRIFQKDAAFSRRASYPNQ